MVPSSVVLAVPTALERGPPAHNRDVNNDHDDSNNTPYRKKPNPKVFSKRPLIFDTEWNNQQQRRRMEGAPPLLRFSFSSEGRSETEEGKNEETEEYDNDETSEELPISAESGEDAMSTGMVGAIRFYKSWISPLLPPACRFVPTCSKYGIQAIEEFGPVKGGILTAWRLLRCSPIGGKGYDPPKWPPVPYTYSSY